MFVIDSKFKVKVHVIIFISFFLPGKFNSNCLKILSGRLFFLLIYFSSNVSFKLQGKINFVFKKMLLREKHTYQLSSKYGQLMCKKYCSFLLHLKISNNEGVCFLTTFVCFLFHTL